MPKEDQDQTAQLFKQYQILLFSIAYRMLGSSKDAEDIVQEAFVRWMQADKSEVRSPKSYLTAIVVRLCLDQLRSAREKREVYVGPELPEPVRTDPRPELVETAILKESLSFAFLILLRSLTPTERAVFLLREVFDYDYAEIAAILELSAANCRQIMHRAHQRLDKRPERYAVPLEQHRRMTEQFLEASTSGDMNSLLNLLASDVVFVADSGGKAPAGLKPVQGKDKVARGMMGALRFYAPGLNARIETINGQPAIVGYQNDRPVGVLLFEIEGDRIQKIFSVVNPDKLRWRQGAQTG